MLAAYGVLASYAYGLLMNLSSWPFLLGVQVLGHTRLAGLRPGRARASTTCRRFLVYTLLTSTGSWDTDRAITTAVAIVVLGPALILLRQAAGGDGPAARGSEADVRPDDQDPVVAGVRGSPAVGAAWSSPQPPVGRRDDGAHPAVVGRRRTPAGRSALPPVRLTRHQPLASARGEPDVAAGAAQAGGRGRVGAPGDLRVDGAPVGAAACPSTSGHP